MDAGTLINATDVPRIPRIDASALASTLGRWLRPLVLQRIGTLDWGQLEIHDRHGVQTIGPADNGPKVKVSVHSDAFFAYVALGGSVGGGQAYFLGLWDCEQLSDLVRIFVRNRDQMDALERGLARLSAPIHRWYHHRRDNTLRGSRSNIAAHYDLGNTFFELFLDESMTYSSAVFADPQATLEQAQIEKIDRICRKLRLGPDDHLIEIGTGWGALAQHAAQRYGARVTTTTISREQHDYARERIARAGLSSRVNVMCEDYRALKGSQFDGQFSKLVSVEMIEAVGHQHFGAFFKQCARLLKPEGQALIQAITIQDRYFTQMTRSVDFIQRYIFPGGCLPSVGALIEAARNHSDLQLAHMEDFGTHYAQTLALWRERMLSELPRIRALGYTDQFLRMWVYYLCYCEGGFQERLIGVAQLVFNKPQHRGEALV